MFHGKSEIADLGTRVSGDWGIEALDSPSNCYWLAHPRFVTGKTRATCGNHQVFGNRNDERPVFASDQQSNDKNPALADSSGMLVDRRMSRWASLCVESSESLLFHE